MSFEIGDEVVGTVESESNTFERTCRITDVRGVLVDVIVYDPDTRMWEDYDLTMVNLPASMFQPRSRVYAVELIRDQVNEVLAHKDPCSAVEVLISRNRLQERYYASEEAVADCAFISREELIRQSVECLVRLATASMAPYNEEVEMSKKQDKGKPGGDKPDLGPHHGAQQSAPPAPVKDELPAHYQGNPALPEAFLGRPPAWRKGFIDRIELGDPRKKPDVVADYMRRNDPTGTSGYTEGWNKAENFVRSGGK